MNQKTPFQIASLWYNSDEVFRVINSVKLGNHFGDPIPRDVTSREFAEWLTEQYQLAMAKGIQLGRGER